MNFDQQVVLKNFLSFILPNPESSTTFNHGELQLQVSTSPQNGYQIALFNRLDVHLKPPDSGERQNKSRTCRRRCDPALRARDRDSARAEDTL